MCIRLADMIIFVTLAVFLAGCGEPITGPASSQDPPRIQVENNESRFEGRIQYHDDEVVKLYKLDSVGTDQIVETKGFELRLRAEVAPPALDALPLHASHVTVKDGFAYVAYSTPNEAFGGGVEIYNIKDKNRPVLISQILLRDTDVRIAIRHGDKLYLGEAIDSEHAEQFSSPACLEAIVLENDKLTDQTQLVDLPSFNANDIAISGNTIFVTSGTTGGALSVLDLNSLEVISRIGMDRAKAVDLNDEHIVVMEGTGTNLHLYDRNSFNFLRTINIGTANFFEAKAEIDVINDKVYLSAWEDGMKVVDLNSGSIIGAIPVRAGGVCNGVSVAGEFVFMANGLNGMLVAQITESGFAPIGRAVFPGSTNFVTARGNQIFVANGRGGFIYIELILGGIELFP